MPARRRPTEARHRADQDQAGVRLARLVGDRARDRAGAQHAAVDLDLVVAANDSQSASSSLEPGPPPASSSRATARAAPRSPSARSPCAPSGWASFDAVASISSSIGPACLHGTMIVPYGTSANSGSSSSSRGMRRGAAGPAAGARSRRRSRRRAARAAADPCPRGASRGRAARRATRAGSPRPPGSGISERPKRTLPRIITGRGRSARRRAA